MPRPNSRNSLCNRSRGAWLSSEPLLAVEALVPLTVSAPQEQQPGQEPVQEPGQAAHSQSSPSAPAGSTKLFWLGTSPEPSVGSRRCNRRSPTAPALRRALAAARRAAASPLGRALAVAHRPAAHRPAAHRPSAPVLVLPSPAPRPRVLPSPEEEAANPEALAADVRLLLRELHSLAAGTSQASKHIGARCLSAPGLHGRRRRGALSHHVPRHYKSEHTEKTDANRPHLPAIGGDDLMRLVAPTSVAHEVEVLDLVVSALTLAGIDPIHRLHLALRLETHLVPACGANASFYGACDSGIFVRKGSTAWWASLVALGASSWRHHG
eukprot:CAMPEP_0183402582 /NCGR_PEP_ID=MMETSP0370-20130417/14002_1 /TAXON_ID=268820 /ORGANISM="Peridinium aciculiferum, Strain PAER-2" /LENGTH=323 /DNA_ID=CAMNT_0025584201 /DNA_START=275 /DNA_END=1243 /DNA_ORIENTATION=-